MERSWIVAAGGKPICEEGPELSSLASYQGEGLANLLQGRTLTNVYDDILQVAARSASNSEGCCLSCGPCS